MSKYLKPGTAARSSARGTLRDSAYASTAGKHPGTTSRYYTQPTPEAQRVASSPKSQFTQSEFVETRHQHTGVGVSTTAYTGSDHQQFAELSEFPVVNYMRKNNKPKTWASCEFTEQDDAGFQRLMQDLSAVADSSR